MKRRIPMICVLVVTAASMAVLAREGGSPPPRHRGPLGLVALPIQRIDAAPTAEAPSPLRYGYVPGLRLAYRVERSYDTTTGLPALPGAAPRETRATISIEGILEMTVLSREGDVSLVSARVEGFSFRGSADGRDLPVVDASELARALASESFLRVASDGEIDGFGFAASMPGRARDIVKGLLLTLHLRFPREARSEWAFDEEDLTGAAHASYSVEPGIVAVAGREARRVTRNRGPYATLANGARAKDSGSASAVAAFAAREGVVVAIEGEEDLACTDERGDCSMRASGSTRVQLVSLDTVSVAAPSVELDWRPAGLAEGLCETERAGRARSRERLAQGRTVTSLSLDLERLFLAEEPDSSALCDAVRRIVALLVGDDAAVREARDLAWRDITSERVRSQLLCCLGMAGTPAAQQALVEAIEDARMPDPLRRSALTGMTQVEAPNAALEAAVRRVADAGADLDRSRQALLVLGQMQNRLLDREPARAGAIRAYIEGRYSSAATVDDRIAALEALGNAGDPATETLLRGAAQDPSERVRAAAMVGLRRMRTEGASALLACGMQDPSEPVRRAAKDAMALRPH